MLRIRREQMEALHEEARRQYLLRVARELADAFPGRLGKLDPAARRALVEKGIAKAAGYGIDEEEDVRAFLDRMARHGEDFEHSKELSWTREILDDKALDGTAKMDEIARRERERAGKA
jgi:hypothetical protein